LKAGLYMTLRRRDMTIADLAELLGMGDWHQAARLIDPKRSTKLTSLAAALYALGCALEIVIDDDGVPIEETRSTGAGPKSVEPEDRADRPARLRKSAG